MNLLKLMGLIEGSQQPQPMLAPEQPVDIGQAGNFDAFGTFDTSPFAKTANPPKMYQGGSIDEILNLLR